MTTSADVARRPNGHAATQQPSAVLALRDGQTMWTRDQHAALVAMGIPKTATSAELGVFMHQCQRTGLDPFIKQIYLIYRDGYENGQKVKKPTTQVGIDGYRLIRDRIAKREGLRVEYEDTIWYASDGTPCDVWLWDDPPAACKVTVVVDGRRFPAVLRFNEYCQRKKDGALNSMWSTKGAHMIEKCCEADALRRAFPQDLSGLMLEDAAPLPEDVAPVQPQRVTAEQIRQRRQTVPSEVIGTPDPSPAQSATPPAASGSPAPDAGEAPGAGGEHPPPLASSGQVGMIRSHLERLGYREDQREDRLRDTATLARYDGKLASTSKLTAGQAASVIRQIEALRNATELVALLEDGEVQQ